MSLWLSLKPLGYLANPILLQMFSRYKVDVVVVVVVSLLHFYPHQIPLLCCSNFFSSKIGWIITKWKCNPGPSSFIQKEFKNKSPQKNSSKHLGNQKRHFNLFFLPYFLLFKGIQHCIRILLKKFASLWAGSSDYRRWLRFWRTWVLIPAPYTGHLFSTFVCCKNAMFVFKELK